MGGYGSGRHGGRATVEGGLTLDLCAMIRKGHVVPGQHVRGTLSWTRTATGERVGSIGFVADMLNPAASWIRLSYTVTRWRDGAKVSRDDFVPLEATRPPFGGLRWWFLCPVTGRRVAKLHLPAGGTIFASRQAFGLAYESQRDSAIQRSHTRQRRIFAKLGEEYECFEQPLPPKPKWMRWRTYDRLCAELRAAEEMHDEISLAGIASLLARIERLGPARPR